MPITIPIPISEHIISANPITETGIGISKSCSIGVINKVMANAKISFTVCGIYISPRAGIVIIIEPTLQNKIKYVYQTYNILKNGEFYAELNDGSIIGSIDNKIYFHFENEIQSWFHVRSATVFIDRVKTS